MTEEEMREMFGDADPFSDFFHTFFGGAGGGGRRRTRGARGAPRAARQGRDVEQEIELELEDAYRGATRRLSIKHDGHARTVDVRIPAGVGDGSRVRVAGEGEHGAGGAQSGDLYLRIRLAPHPTFERKGRDLYTHVAVPLTTAVLGGEVEGADARRQIAATEDSADDAERAGVPAEGSRHAGGRASPTSAAISTRRSTSSCPKQLTPEQREHFEALQKLSNERHETDGDVMNINKYTEKAQEADARRPTARRADESSADRARTPARRTRRTARGHRARTARKMSADPADDRLAAHASCWRKLRRRTAALSRVCRRA